MELEDFLALPLVARVAMNCPRGPTIRPIWFLYEDAAFWWLTGSSYSRLGEWLARDPRVALVVDTCDLSTGEVLGVTAVGRAEVGPLDVDRAKRKLAKYLGSDEELWDQRFREAFLDTTTRIVSLRPDHRLRLRDLSFTPSVSTIHPRNPRR